MVTRIIFDAPITVALLRHCVFIWEDRWVLTNLSLLFILLVSYYNDLLHAVQVFNFISIKLKLTESAFRRVRILILLLLHLTIYLPTYLLYSSLNMKINYVYDRIFFKTASIPT